MGQYFYPTSLVDEIDSAAIQRLQLALDHRVSSQEDDRQFVPARLMARSRSRPDIAGMAQSEQRSLEIDAAIQRLKEGGPSAKDRNHKPPIGQVR